MKSLDPFGVDFSGVHLIEASAGTGKTYNIESLYVRAVIEEDRTVDEILVVTYTEAATKELRDRLMRRLSESIEALEGKSFERDDFLNELRQRINQPLKAILKLEKALRTFDEAAVYTIHGFCGQALRDHAFESGASFEAELIGDDRDIVADLIDDYWRSWVEEASKNKMKRPLLQLLLDKGYTPEVLTNELATFWGRPYLQIKPDEISLDIYDKIVYELGDLYEYMQQLWHEDNEQIRSLLLSEPMSGRRYQDRYLQNWMPAMNEWLQADVLPIKRFDMFSRFSQSYVNDSLKKSSEKKGVAPPQHPFFKQVDLYNEKAESLNNYDTHFKRKLFSELATKLNDRKEELQVYSYDDLLVQLKNALVDEDRGAALCRKLQQTYPIALVDEFQDTDPVQYQIFSYIYSGSQQAALFMIGDPKQSIYSFRGADIFSYLQARQEVPSEKIFNLAYNYRSVPSLINGINTLFSFQENPFVLEDIGFQPVQSGKKSYDSLTFNGSAIAPIQIRQFLYSEGDGPLTKKMASNIAALDTASQIQKLLIQAQSGKTSIGENALEAGDIAVLVGTHRQATLIRDALQQYGIKSLTHSKASVFKSDEAREFCTVLKAVIEPGNESRIVTALATTMFNYDANELLALKDDELAWTAKVNQFNRWHELWQKYGFARMLRTLMHEEGVAQTLMQYDYGERKLTNLIHLSELIQAEQKTGNKGIHTLFKWLLKKRQEDNNDIEDEQLRLESDENLVKVVTMHYSKGLEYPVVFCPFLWNSIQKKDRGAPIVYHHPEHKTIEYLDLNGKEDPARAQKRYQKEMEVLAEGVRLAYVAITRAKYRCVISCMPVNKSAYSPLGLLLLGTKKSLQCLQASLFPDRDKDDTVLKRFNIAIEKLTEHDSIESSVISPHFTPQKELLQHTELKQLRPRSFSRPVPLAEGHRMSSFSSLTRNESDDFEPDFHAYFDEPLDRTEEQSPRGDDSFFDFPKGPDPGTAVHHIFENIDFSDSLGWDDVIAEQLENQNIDAKWQDVVNEMVQVAVDKKLLPNKAPLTLAGINTEDMIAEMEFYFSNGKILLSHILRIVRDKEVFSAAHEGFAGTGFLKGFIDLTFGYDGKFYILDYKTNYLGSAVDDYSQDHLREEMQEACYDVQYHLYLVALHRFLNQRIPDYTYEKHMGGALYLFLRGMNSEGREGIFFDRPEATRIAELDEYLKREEI